MDSYQLTLMGKSLCPKNVEIAASRAQQLFWLHELVAQETTTFNSISS
uniref:Uncharacterized protein n=1 Tax=Heterorhabditis bacteriophora TaxID=37862 RepID=A0A1I7XBU5_HETBA